MFNGMAALGMVVKQLIPREMSDMLNSSETTSHRIMSAPAALVGN
jgi:hypothetical protein